MMVVVGGRNPGGTARWYSPAGAGTRHLTRGGGSNHLHLPRGKGRDLLSEPSWRCDRPWLRRLFALPSPRAASPLRPPSGSHARPAARTSPPLPALVGPGRQLGALRAPAAAVGRALGVRRAVSAGGRGGGGLRGSGTLLCLGRLRRRPAVDRWCPRDPARPRSDGVGVAGVGRSWRTVSAVGRARAEVHVRSGSSPRPLGSRLVIPADRLLSLSTFEPAASCQALHQTERMQRSGIAGVRACLPSLSWRIGGFRSILSQCLPTSKHEPVLGLNPRVRRLSRPTHPGPVPSAPVQIWPGSSSPNGLETQKQSSLKTELLVTVCGLWVRPTPSFLFPPFAGSSLRAGRYAACPGYPPTHSSHGTAAASTLRSRAYMML